MKLSCCNRYILLFILLCSAAFGAINDKSAIVYYGNKISYPMVGIHNYIIVQPTHTNTATHGFKVYKDKMYAYVSIGEIDKDIKEFTKIKKEWIVGNNKAWNSPVLDLTNPEYKEFLFKDIIQPQMKRGFKNFFFDTLDSYQLVCKTKEQRAKSEAALVDIINTFHKRYPDSKLIINRGFEIIDKVHESVNAVLFESYYHGLAGKDLSYQKVSEQDRSWLDTYIKKIQQYKLDLICVDYLPLEDLNSKEAQETINKITEKGMIPYLATKDLTTYGKSAKNPVKREILTLIDESRYDKIFLSAHQHGALPLEYQGYIQKLYDIHTHKLPTMEAMQQYGGVVIWFTKEYKNPDKLIEWILKLQKYNIKVVFAGTLPLPLNDSLNKLSIKINDDADKIGRGKVLHKDAMLGYEIEPSLNDSESFIDITQGKKLFSMLNSNGVETTYAALMPWGGFALRNAFMQEFNNDNLWVIDPFKFFKTALHLPTIIVPDVTTQNGKRILFSHVDGDGIMNRVEWDPKLFSGDIIYSDVLKKYTVPISVSIIGAEVDDNGLYPKIAPQLQQIVKQMYRLSNVEPATHTFTHPFFWNKIHNGDLDPKYRLKPKGYHFSLENETKGMLDEINVKYLPKNKYPKAKTIFWSGDCAPTEMVLDYVYRENLLNINGGDTYITNAHPWLSYIAPLGIRRGEYYQIYTGAQNENIYTNEWLGPYWGFKKVIQTFKHTDSPRRLKAIDIYYHLYSGSKRASLNALHYVYDWAIKQDVNPIFTSEYIPKVMDYYTVSLAQENHHYFIAGMKNLKTLRLEDEKKYVDMNSSHNLLGFKRIKNHTYIHLGQNKEATVSLAQNMHNKNGYLISTNAAVVKSEFRDDGFSMELKSYLPIKLELNIPKKCHYSFSSQASNISSNGDIIAFNYKKKREVTFNVLCK